MITFLIIQYNSTLNLLCIWIYPIIQLYIYIYVCVYTYIYVHIYLYIYINFGVFVYSNIVATHAHAGHTFMVKFWQVSNIVLKCNYKRCSIKKLFLNSNSNINSEALVLESLFNKFASLQVGNFITKRLQHSCFPVSIAKFLKTYIVNDIFERLFWTLLIQSGRYSNRKNRDLFRDDNRRRIQNPVKDLRWSFLQ